MDHGHGSFYTPLVISVEEKRSHPLCSGWPDCCHLVYIGGSGYVYNPDLMQKSVLSHWAIGEQHLSVKVIKI
jgi:hypothetical protein